LQTLSNFFDLLPALILLLISGLFSLLSVILLIVICFLKEGARTVAINFLLGLATMPIACLLMISSVTATTELPDSKIKAGIDTSTLTLNLSAVTAYAVKHDSFIKAGVDLGYPLESEQNMLKDAETVEKERTEHRPLRKKGWASKRKIWCAQYALVSQALGESDKARTTLEKVEPGDSTGLIKAVKNVTCAVDQAPQTDEDKERALAGLKLLPEGWYRDEAFMFASKAFHDDKISEAVELARDVRGARALPALAAIMGLVLAVNVLGVVALITGILQHQKFLPNRADFHLKSITFRQVYGVLLFSCYFQLLAMAVGWFPTEHFMGAATAEKWQLPFGLAGGVVGYFAALYFFVLRKLQGPSGWSLLSLDSPRSQYLRLIATGVGTFCLLILFDTVWSFSTARFFHNSTNNPISVQMVSWSAHPTIAIIAFSILFIGLLAPIAEEIVFRALFFGWLRKRFSVLVSVLINGLTFAAFHGDPGQFVQLSAAGCLFAFVYARTGSLIPSITAHACMNCTSVLITFLLGYAGKT
jgi:membrane protease YdiL (CAAX protease family)